MSEEEGGAKVEERTEGASSAQALGESSAGVVSIADVAKLRSEGKRGGGERGERQRTAPQLLTSERVSRRMQVGMLRMSTRV